MIRKAIEKVVECVDLEEQEMIDVMNFIMSGEATPNQISAFLIGLRMKGETVSEITAAARVMRQKANKVKYKGENVVIDLCGTGGDKKGTFNISTVSSFIVSGAGIAVAKHGNKSVSSKVGSADVLEELGVNIGINPASSEKCLNELGIAFLFAPNYHPAMKNVSQTRMEIAVRTIFNVLGPISNPVDLKHQVIGVYSHALLEPIAKVLRNMGYERAMVVHGTDSLDEITVTGKTYVSELKDGIVKNYKLDPGALGIKKADLKELKGGDRKQNAEIAISILTGEENGAKRDIALLNASASILVANEASDFKEAFDIAISSLDSGKALEKLEELIKFTNSVN